MKPVSRWVARLVGLRDGSLRDANGRINHLMILILVAYCFR